MQRKTLKVSRILFYYSLTVTALLIFIFVIFIITISVPKTNLPKYLMTIRGEYFASFIENGDLEIPLNYRYLVLINKTNLEKYYIDALLKNMPVLIVCLVIMLIVGTFILSRILKVQSEKQALFLAKQLSSIDDHSFITEQHPAVAKAYQEIKDKLEAYALDYVRLSSYVTHEQKNILSLLRAKLQLSENATLTAEVDKVTDSLNDILTLSATKNREKFEMVDAALICADTCDEYRKIYPQIYFDFDEDANNMIRARELWISRAVSNLISNAIKYGENSDIHVSVTNKKGSVIIAVSDEGEGIDEAEQEKLFDYQYRVGKLKKDGYGIGLSLVRHVCELCGGLCWVENRDVRGTTFFMIFPEALTLD